MKKVSRIVVLKDEVYLLKNQLEERDARLARLEDASGTVVLRIPDVEKLMTEGEDVYLEHFRWSDTNDPLPSEARKALLKAAAAMIAAAFGAKKEGGER